ncbi:hypothetical protein ACP70R_045733 [Stipagrostis hirtigluma subsp. patula]
MDFTLPLLAIPILLVLLLPKLISRYTSPSRTEQQAPRLPPGPRQLPLVGSLHHLLLSPSREVPHQAMRELSKTYGPLMLLRLGAVPTLVVSSAEAAREVLLTQDVSFCDRGLTARTGIISGRGQGVIFSPYHHRWRELRKVCALDLFSPQRVLSFRAVREEEVARLIGSISDECGGGGGGHVNLREKIGRMVDNITMRTTIGGRCRHQDEFFHHLDEAFR